MIIDDECESAIRHRVRGDNNVFHLEIKYSTHRYESALGCEKIALAVCLAAHDWHCARRA